jgi:hypothetical protein
MLGVPQIQPREDRGDILNSSRQNKSNFTEQDSLLTGREDRYPLLNNQSLSPLGWSRKQIRGIERMCAVVKVVRHDRHEGSWMYFR